MVYFCNPIFTKPMRLLKLTLFILLSITTITLIAALLSAFYNKSNTADCISYSQLDKPNSSANLPLTTKQTAIKALHTINLDSVLWIAKKYIGTPYKMGGMSFSGMDCSGLVKAVFKEMGYTLPHNSSELAKNGILISKLADIKKGDLLFFHTDWEPESHINHTGIYLGNGYFIHATSSLGTIISKVTDPSYKNDFICATRLLISQPINYLTHNKDLIIIQ